MNDNDTGLLLNNSNIKLQRKYFSEMVKLLGVQLIYRAPRGDKTYNDYGELDAHYFEPMTVGCLFNEHPNQYTMKKLGWNSESQEEVSLVTVPYDTPNIQVGALFIVPSGIDNVQGRTFKVIRMSTISIYPASITCEIAPVFDNEFEPSQYVHKNNNFDLLVEEDD